MIESLSKLPRNLRRKIRNEITNDPEFYKYYLSTQVELSSLATNLGIVNRIYLSRSGDTWNGIYTATVNTRSKQVEALSVLSFKVNPKEFLRDFRRVLEVLHDNPNIRRVEFQMPRTAPTRAFLRYAKRFYNIRHVGIRTEAVKLLDGTYEDLIIYEVLKEGAWEHRPQ